MKHKKIQVAALCAFLMLAKLHAQTGVADPKQRAQWEKEQRLLNQNNASPQSRTAGTPNKGTKSESAIQLAERLGLLRTANGNFAVKWHNSDLILALPENTNSNNPNNAANSLNLERDKRTRQDYAQYSFLLPNGKPLAAIRTEVIPADTTNGVPEFWLFRALNLTEQEFQMGSQALEALGTSELNWPTAVPQTATKPSVKSLKLLETAEKVREATDDLLQKNSLWYLTAPGTESSQTPILHIAYGGRGICSQTTYPENSTSAQLIRTAPLAAQLYYKALPYISRLEAKPSPSEQVLLLKDLRLLGDNFFQQYDANADAAFLANILLLVEANNPDNWLTSNPAYSSFRGQNKATYPFAQTIVRNSIFSDPARYRQWLNQPQDTLLQQLIKDPIALWLGRPEVEFQTFAYTAPATLDAKNHTQLFYVPKTALQPSSLIYSTNLTDLLNKRAKQYLKADKKEKQTFSQRFTATPNESQAPTRASRKK